MKSYRLVLVLIVFFSVVLHAQEQAPVKKKASFGDNGRLYTNKDLGLYLWLSTSPDENSKKIRLMSDSSKNYTNPMYFDTEGYNTFRSPSCVDTSTKKVVYPMHDIIFEVYSDSRAPVTKAVIRGEQSKRKRNKKIYTEKTDIELKAFDATSGVEKIYYSINNQPYQEYNKSFSIQDKGENILKYYSTDLVGNREEVKKQKIVIE